MRDMPIDSGPPGELNAVGVTRAQARELVAGWMDGAGSTRPPADILLVEQLGSIDDASMRVSIGTFCWPIDTGAGVRQ